MTLLFPTALFGLAVLAVPILIHLLKPRKLRDTPFISLGRLMEPHQKRSRRIQWHQMILFLLRSGMLPCLVFALAQPLIGVDEGNKPVERFILLDVSRSMSYRGLDEPSRF